MVKLDVPIEVKNDLNTLFNHAVGDSGGSRRCAMFLLSLWDGDTFKVDLQAILYSDAEIFSPMMRVLQYLYGTNQQLDTLVPEKRMKLVFELWGEDLQTIGH